MIRYLREKRDSEKENLLSAFNPRFGPFFSKTSSCCLLSYSNLHVLRMRNKSLHKNPRVSFQVFEGKLWSPVELLGQFVISLGTVLNASGVRFCFEVYFMFCCGFQISHGLDLGK